MEIYFHAPSQKREISFILHIFYTYVYLYILNILPCIYVPVCIRRCIVMYSIIISPNIIQIVLSLKKVQLVKN